MNPSVHIISSFIVFGLLFKMGAPLDFVIIAFGTSILIDADHLLFGRMVGSYNPKKIYDFCMNNGILKFMPPRRLVFSRIIDFRVLPFHNIVLAVVAIFLYLPVGLGLLFHIILDVFSDIIGVHFYNCQKRCHKNIKIN